MAGETRVPITLDLPAEMSDHLYLDRPVLPAVEALRRLADVAAEQRPAVDVRRTIDARFLRFLALDDAEKWPAAVQLGDGEGGEVVASLLTLRRAGRSGITRAVEHVRVTFGERVDTAPPALPDAARDGDPFVVSADNLYREMVPFGPAFHSLTGSATVHRGFAEAPLAPPSWARGRPELGSPLCLDGAMHLACAWGQRIFGCVAFPTGYGERIVVRPTVAGETYTAKVVPKPALLNSGLFGNASTKLDFSVWILDDAGRVCEWVDGVAMEDLSRGRARVPAWVHPAGDR